MSLDAARAYGWIVEELATDRSPAGKMARLIEKCEVACPHADWARLQQLPYDDLSPLLEWIQRPFRLSPPREALQGLWFGMFNPYYDNAPVADLYICGSTRFDPKATDGDCAVGPEWWPEARCANSEIMATIYRIAYEEGGLGNDAEYPLYLGYGAFAVRHVLDNLAPSVIPATINAVGVAVGFDSGDAIVLGRLTPDGIRPFQATAIDVLAEGRNRSKE